MAIQRLIRNTHLFALLLLGATCIATPLALAQSAPPPPYTEPPPGSTPAKPPDWAVISIKPNKSQDNGMRFFFTPDGVSFNNIPVQMILRQAYDLQDDLIFGAPDWVKSEKYDVEAKVDGADVAALKTIPYEQRGVMLQSLLADRLKLAVHTETRQLSVYELHIAKSGSKLHEATPGDTYPHGFKGPDGVSHGGMMTIGRGQFTGQAVNLSVVIKQLSQQLHRTIVDKTGLTGKYDFSLQWTPDQGLGGGPPGPDGGAHDAPPPPDSSGPSIFTAVEEQLGLKLEPTKGPVSTLVIDHIEKPSEN